MAKAGKDNSKLDIYGYFSAQDNKPNSIFLFGEFTIFNRHGLNIAYKLAPKQKQLFLYLLIKSLSPQRGIHTKSLTLHMWPELEINQARNNRSVSINKLRSVLSELDGVNLTVDNQHWFMDLKDDVYCDYLDFLLLLHSENHTDQSFSKIKSILRRGELMNSIGNEWFETERIRLVDDFVERFKKILFHNHYDHDIHLQLADCILLLDPLNEQMLKVKVQTAKLLGNHSMAQHTFELFRKEYLALYGEEYPKTIRDL